METVIDESLDGYHRSELRNSPLITLSRKAELLIIGELTLRQTVQILI